MNYDSRSLAKLRRNHFTNVSAAVCAAFLLVLFSAGSAKSDNWLGLTPLPGPSGDLTNMALLDMPAPQRFRPTIGVEVGTVALARSAPDPFTIAVTDGTFEPVATSDALDPELAFGPRIGCTLYNITDHVPGLDIDFLFYRVDDLVANPVITSAGASTPLITPVFFGVVSAVPQSSYHLELDSDLQSFEWMIGYRPIQRLKISAGIRYLKLRESYDTLRSNTVNTNTVIGFFSDLENEAVGFQIGGDVTILNTGRTRVFAKGKYATLENDVEGKGESLTTTLNYSGDIDTDLFEYEIGAQFAIARWASIQIAYQALTLNDAVGAMEASNSLLLTGPATQQPVFHDLDWRGFNLVASLIW